MRRRSTKELRIDIIIESTHEREERKPSLDFMPG